MWPGQQPESPAKGLFSHFSLEKTSTSPSYSIYMAAATKNNPPAAQMSIDPANGKRRSILCPLYPQVLTPGKVSSDHKGNRVNISSKENVSLLLFLKFPRFPNTPQFDFPSSEWLSADSFMLIASFLAGVPGPLGRAG